MEEASSYGGITAEQGWEIIQGLQAISDFIAAGIVLFGIVLSFVATRFFWRFAIKPFLRDYMKLPW